MNDEIILGITWLELLVTCLCVIPVYYTAFCLLLIELAIDRRAGRTKEGMLQIKEKGFVIQYFYELNIYREKGLSKPKDICQLFWGIFMLAWFSAITLIVWSLFKYIVLFLLIIVHTFFGHLPRFLLPPNDFFEFFSKDHFYRYQRYGKKEKKWLAPWKYLLLILCILTLSSGYGIAILIIGTIITWIVVLFGMFFLYLIILEIWKIFPPRFAIKEFIKSKKEKSCIRLV